MKISAHLENGAGQNHIKLVTNGSAQSIHIPPRENGFGSSANGGELLFLALATCYCNDVYREAAKRGISVHRVEVDVEGNFGAAGELARNITYRARVAAAASDDQIRDLLTHTDRVAEIHNTVRAGIPVTLNEIEVLHE